MTPDRALDRQVATISCFLGGEFYKTVKVTLPPMPDLYFAELGKLFKFQAYQRYDGSFFYATSLAARRTENE